MAMRIGGTATAGALALAGARRALATQPTVAVEGAVNMVRASPDTRRLGWEHARGGRAPVGDRWDGRPAPPRPEASEVLGEAVYIGAGGEVVIGVQDVLQFWSPDDWRTWNRLGVDDRIESINLENYAEGPRKDEAPAGTDPPDEGARTDGWEGEEPPVTSVDARDTTVSGPSPPGSGRPAEGPEEEPERTVVAGIRQDGVGPLADYLDAPHPPPAKHPHWVEPPPEPQEQRIPLDIER